MVHKSVLLNEALEALDIKSDGIYVDVTFGAGGHAKSILNQLGAKGRLFGIDQDFDALNHDIKDERFTFIRGNFSFLINYLHYYGVHKIDGLLADLGVSSHQFDTAVRGFSYRSDADLDMRMNTQSILKADTILNKYSEGDLCKIFEQYGEVRNTKTLVRAILGHRKTKKFKTVSDLNEILKKLAFRDKMKYQSQVYQALRMEVNGEVDSLKALITQTTTLLKKGGRFVVISFHSIEDRLVKRYFKTGNFEGILNKDDYGNLIKPLRSLHSKPVIPSQEEQLENRRARSAKLRVAEKL